MSDFSTITDWYPYYLNGNAWDKCSVAIEKPYVYTSPTEISIAYINSNIAYVGKANITAINVLAGIVQLGPAIDISICYDARWYLGANKEYITYTTGTMFIALVDTNKNLYVKMNTSGAQIKLATNVDKCFIIRGWKHISDVTIDQGVNVFYTKGGILYYRSYVQVDSQTFEWNDEQQLSTSKYVSDIEAYRTSDFRIAICTRYSDNTNQLLITNRVFPGQSIPVETVSIVSSTDIIVSSIPVKNVEQKYTESAHVLCNADNLQIVAGSLDNTNAVARNTSGDTIVLSIPTNIPVSSYTQLTQNVNVKDSDNNVYPIISAEYIAPWIVLNVADFNNAVGNITLTYTSGIDGYLGTIVKPFACTFSPVGLVPTPPDPPIVVSAINVNSEVI